MLAVACRYLLESGDVVAWFKGLSVRHITRDSATPIAPFALSVTYIPLLQPPDLRATQSLTRLHLLHLHRFTETRNQPSSLRADDLEGDEQMKLSVPA